MKSLFRAVAFAVASAAMVGCESLSSFDFDSDAIVGGGAVAGKDYITGLKPSADARRYFSKSSAANAQKVTVSRYQENDLGIEWTDDGGIVIPPGVTIEFSNKGYCMDPHLPAPKSGDEMQFVRTASLIPMELRGTYKNLLRRAADGDEEVKSNMQRLVWALRTAGSNDAMATHLTERQREILSECAEGGSFDGYVAGIKAREMLFNEIKGAVGDKLDVKVGNVTYSAFDLLEPETAKAKVEAHLNSLINMGKNTPVVKSGFNYGEIQKGIYTDIKGNGSLSYHAKIANSTSESFTFYPMDYAAQVGSGGSSQGFFATSPGMKQRTTSDTPEEVEGQQTETAPRPSETAPRPSENTQEKPWDFVRTTVVLTYPPQDIVLPNGNIFHFSGGNVAVDVRNMDGWFYRLVFGEQPSNAPAFSARNQIWMTHNVYIRPDTTMEELYHEGIHIMNIDNPELAKYKDALGNATKNEEYLAYMISEKGRRTPEEVRRHIDNERAYDTKVWVSW